MQLRSEYNKNHIGIHDVQAISAPPIHSGTKPNVALAGSMRMTNVHFGSILSDRRLLLLSCLRFHFIFLDILNATLGSFHLPALNLSSANFYIFTSSPRFIHFVFFCEVLIERHGTHSH